MTHYFLQVIKLEIMKVNIDYQRPVTQGDLPNSELTLDYINHAATQAYPNGLEGQVRRIYGRIQRKIDEAISAKEDEVDLETAEKDFLKKIFKEAKFPASLSKYVLLLEDEIDNIN